MLIPLLAWTVTGSIFLIKPGYDGAYDRLTVKAYPLATVPSIQPKNSWREVKVIQTILGLHLLVNKNGEWFQLHPEKLTIKSPPTEESLIQLVDDSLSQNRQRYGEVVSYSEGIYFTDKGVEITFDWHTLTFQQKGWDTQVINTLYKIHYLQWSNHTTTNTLFGVSGLVLLLLLVLYGALAYVKSMARRKEP